MAWTLKVGDRVRIRRDLVVGEEYGGFTLWSGMDDYKGKEGNVISTSLADCYGLDISPYMWPREMLELVKGGEAMKFQLGDKVKVKSGLTIGKVYGTCFTLTMESHLQGLKGTVVAIDHDDDSCLVSYKESEDIDFLQDWFPFEMLTNKREFNGLEV